MTDGATSLAERLVTKVAERTARLRTSRRSFLGGAALMGAALAVDPFGYLTRPASAYDAVCGADNTCAAGYTVFCCTINGGNNSCPPDSFIGGWWKADNSSFCGGNARYYIDCNAYRDGRYSCHCNTTTCDQRRVACNQFRYGQCNTQIPWSNTGPVLCRVVSCTPPWVQYGGVCSASSATDNNTATHSAPCLTGRPVGVVEQVSSTGNTVHISGWAYDPDSPSTSLKIAIYSDGHGLMGVTASVPRPDVNSKYHITGNHGFSASFQASSGKHTYTVFAINIGNGSGNPQIGGRTIIVNAGTSPIGQMERCDPVGDSMVISGWAFDRDAPSTSIGVAIYQDNKPLMGIHASVPRGDVNSAYGITGDHGFTVQFKTTVGAHNYKVYAINVGGGTGNTLIGNHSTVVRGTAAAAPAGQSAIPAEHSATRLAGRLESVSSTGNSVRLVGWAADPAAPDAELAIAVLEDGAVLHRCPTSIARPELAEPHRGGRPGFDITIPAGTGLHEYSVHVLDSAYDPDTSLLGRQTVRVNQAGPIGRVDQLCQLGDLVRLIGWAYDPDRPTAELALIVYRDGEPLSRHRTGLAHPTSVGTDGGLGRPGFDISLPAAPGPHSYTVYALATGPGARQVLLGGGTPAADAAGMHPAEVTV
ncbi:MAG: twin-arginine translocation signal domain-containing protein [Jatrophihabitantaceae bacterium]